MRKKGQVAMESLMIYGIALIIVALAIGALIYFGVLDLGGLLPDSCKIKGGSFDCTDYAWVDNALYLQINNRVGKTIVEVGDTECTYIEEGMQTEEDFDVLEEVGGSAKTNVANGDFFVLEGGTESVVTDGSKTKVSFKCSYNLAGSTIPRSFNGELIVTVSKSS